MSVATDRWLDEHLDGPAAWRSPRAPLAKPARKPKRAAPRPTHAPDSPEPR